MKYATPKTFALKGFKSLVVIPYHVQEKKEYALSLTSDVLEGFMIVLDKAELIKLRDEIIRTLNI